MEVYAHVLPDMQQQAATTLGALLPILKDELRDAVLHAYVAMASANSLIEAVWHHPTGSNPWAEATNAAFVRMNAAAPKIRAAQDELLKFLGSDGYALNV